MYQDGINKSESKEDSIKEKEYLSCLMLYGFIYLNSNLDNSIDQFDMTFYNELSHVFSKFPL